MNIGGAQPTVRPRLSEMSYCQTKLFVIVLYLLGGLIQGSPAMTATSAAKVLPGSGR